MSHFVVVLLLIMCAMGFSVAVVLCLTYFADEMLNQDSEPWENDDGSKES
jgi:hypothetical protein